MSDYLIETNDMFFREASPEEVQYVYRNLKNRAFGYQYIHDNPFSINRPVDYLTVAYREIENQTLLKYVVFEKDHNRPVALVDIKEDRNGSWKISEVVVGHSFRYDGFDLMILTELCIYAVKKGAIAIIFGCFSEDKDTKQMLEEGEFIYTYSDSNSVLQNGRHVSGDYYMASNILMTKLDRMARTEGKIVKYGGDILPIPTLLEGLQFAWWNT